MTKHKATVPVVLLIWFVANFVPHIIVFLATGKIYYQLTFIWAIAVENSIVLLNLLIPVIALCYLLRQRYHIFQNLGWLLEVAIYIVRGIVIQFKNTGIIGDQTLSPCQWRSLFNSQLRSLIICLTLHNSQPVLLWNSERKLKNLC
jgi:hypothetical protein